MTVSAGNDSALNVIYDADGDVLQRMQDSGFDFSQKCVIDFNVDFEAWPPSPAAIEMLRRTYPSTVVYEPDAKDPGYLQFQVYDFVTHKLVTRVQAEVTNLMAPFGGECVSWGVLQPSKAAE